VKAGARFDDLVTVVTAVCLAVGQDADAGARTARLVDLFLGGILQDATKPTRLPRSRPPTR